MEETCRISKQSIHFIYCSWGALHAVKTQDSESVREFNGKSCSWIAHNWCTALSSPYTLEISHRGWVKVSPFWNQWGIRSRLWNIGVGALFAWPLADKDTQDAVQHPLSERISTETSQGRALISTLWARLRFHTHYLLLELLWCLSDFMFTEFMFKHLSMSWPSGQMVKVWCETAASCRGMWGIILLESLGCMAVQGH